MMEALRVLTLSSAKYTPLTNSYCDCGYYSFASCDDLLLVKLWVQYKGNSKSV